MLGTFDLPAIGRFVVSGDTPDEFLWDLFDQIVIGANVVMQMGGATITIPGRDPACDAGDRRAARGTEAWRRAHSDYFVAKIAAGSLLFSLDLPEELFFRLHSTGLLGAVMSETSGDLGTNLHYNILLAKHGHGTPEYQAGVAALPSHNYPYATLTSESLINYLMRQGVLVLNEAAGPSAPGILTMDEAREVIRARKARLAELREEMRREAIAARDRQRQRKPGRAPRPLRVEEVQ